jgi:hypothetical protein
MTDPQDHLSHRQERAASAVALLKTVAAYCALALLVLVTVAVGLAIIVGVLKAF